MSHKDNGGPAFPWCGDMNDCPAIFMGMSRRDWFAGQALAGLAASPQKVARRGNETRAQADARWCYERADALIEAGK